MENKFTNVKIENNYRESSRINCTITDADFNTNRPNPRRIERAAWDINEYLNYKKRRTEGM